MPSPRRRHLHRSIGLVLAISLAWSLAGHRASARPHSDSPEDSATSKPDSPAPIAEPVRYPSIRDELLAMGRKDQAVREPIAPLVEAGTATSDNPAFLPLVQAMIAADRANTARLEEIIDQIGWPTIPAVGEDGAELAWLIAQHSKGRFQDRCLALLEEAAAADLIERWQYAYLLDRTLVEQGRPQIYGSQVRFLEDRDGPYHGLGPVVDPANLDARRAEVGLKPIAEQFKDYEKDYGFPLRGPEAPDEEATTAPADGR